MNSKKKEPKKKKATKKDKKKEKDSSSSVGSEDIDASKAMPVLASQDLVPFPSVMMSLYVERSLNLAAVQAAQADDEMLFVVAQKDEEILEPSQEDLYRVGVVANIVRTLELADGRYKVLLQGLLRGKVSKYQKEKSYIAVQLEPIITPEAVDPDEETKERIQRIRENLQALVEFEHLPEEMLLVTEEISDPGVLADLIIAHFKLDNKYAQAILEEMNPLKRLETTDQVVLDDLNQFILSEKIKDRTRDELTKGQKDFYLREQLKQIQKELGEGDSSSEDQSALKEALDKARLPEHAAKEAGKQLQRLERMHPETSEYAMLRTYLEWISDIPWSVRTKDRLNLKAAQKILDADHYGLEKPKDRILEYLSVRKLKKDSKGPILCFVGPPGVGKTSLGRSIARCLNRKYFRMALGGVRDEAEIRGHRRTYVGALPGRIIQGIKEAGSNNPVFLLDELDKIGADFRGDPAAALLEILDPEQNKYFRDHYLNLKFDLSKCMFIATANTLDTIPDALLDRLEVTYISGYTTNEKLNIAQRFLVPNQVKDKGLNKFNLEFDEETITFLIERYTREAGVRNLEKEIAAVCRKLAREFIENGGVSPKVTVDVVQELLGITRFDPEVNEDEALVGLVRGLAWTIHGGEVMPVEASIAKGSGKLNLTGQLGDVMQESARAGMFYARANAAELALDDKFSEKIDIHIHVPGGATPKDGPSAGVTIVTALVSALTKRKVAKDIAMTGEITLRGKVLPVGGLKEKALAALRYGIEKVIIPQGNLKDLEEIPPEQREQLEFIPVKHLHEVLDLALVKSKVSKGKKKKGKSSQVMKRSLIVEK